MVGVAHLRRRGCSCLRDVSLECDPLAFQRCCKSHSALLTLVALAVSSAQFLSACSANRTWVSDPSPREGLTWFIDRTGPELPQPFVVSVSIWFYKLAMLLWALWLSFALLRWLPWAWRQFSSHGIWKGDVPAPA